MRLLWLFLFLPVALSAQPGPGPDSLTARRDSLRTDSTAVAPDSLPGKRGADTVVVYSCRDSIIYAIPSKAMSLYTAATIKYEQMDLRSDRITIDWGTSVLGARGIPDPADSTGTKFIGTPIMKDGGEEYHGHDLTYNFKTRRGKIDVADTRIDQGYYHGEAIKKADSQTLWVGDGRFTTCDAAEPHYYFGSPKMKVTVQDKIIAEPVFLYIADVPVFALPFGVFPNKGGRRSGLIAPAIVEDQTRGRLLQHIGYYFALSDYTDLSLRTDLYTKGSWAGYSDFRYALRDHFSGSLSGDYKRLLTGEPGDPGRGIDESYRATLLHNQEIDPTMHLTANFTLASNNSYLNTIDINQSLQQSIASNATLSKSWEGTPNSMSLSVSRNQLLTNGNITETLPSLNFNHSQSYPFRAKKSTESDLAWYEMIGVSYGGTASNTHAKSARTVSGVKTGAGGLDSVTTVSDFEQDHAQSLSQSVSMSIAPKLGYFTLTPSLSYRDDRTFSSNDVPSLRASDSTLTDSTFKDSRKTGVLSAGISAATRIYGTVQPMILGIAALRHTLTPSLSFNYQKQIIGTDLTGRQMSASFNLGNVFEMKMIPKEEGKEPDKIQLLNLSGGLSYNFSADSLNFSPIGINYRTGIGELLTLDGGATYDLYKLQQTGPAAYTRVNTFLWNSEHRLARLTDFRISVSTALAGDKKKDSGGSSSDTLPAATPRTGTFGIYQDEEPDFSIPWRLGVALDYSEHVDPLFPSRSSTLRGNLDFNLTEKWKFSMSGGYDVVNREIVAPHIQISRDLHCWLMNFDWSPIGTNRYYRFEIRIKASQLQDIKVTKQGSDRGVY